MGNEHDTYDDVPTRADAETDRAASFLRKTLWADRKYNARLYNVSVRTMRAHGGGAGRVVVLTRNGQTDEVVDRTVCTLDDALQNGIPLPNLLGIASRM